MAVEMAGQLELPARGAPGAGADDAGEAAYTAIAIYDGHQWASLCPELDIASMGGDYEEAIRNVMGAVQEAVQLADDEGLNPGIATPDDELRRFIISGQAPFHVFRFYV